MVPGQLDAGLSVFVYVAEAEHVKGERLVRVYSLFFGKRVKSGDFLSFERVGLLFGKVASHPVEAPRELAREFFYRLFAEGRRELVRARGVPVFRVDEEARRRHGNRERDAVPVLDAPARGADRDVGPVLLLRLLDYAAVGPELYLRRPRGEHAQHRDDGEPYRM